MFIDLSAPEWDEFFPDLCAIEKTGETTTNDLGEPVTLPVPLEGHQAIGCQLIYKTGKVLNSTGQTVSVQTIEINLRGCFPEVEAEMTAIVGLKRFRITSAGDDSQHVKTKLAVEVTK